MTPRRTVFALAAFVAVVLAGNAGMGRLAVAWDLTAEGSATLSDETLRVLGEVDRRVEITAFFSRDAVGRVEAATLLSRYRNATRRISFRILDPQLAPGEAQRLGVLGSGSAAVQDVADPDRIEIAQFTIEIDVTSAIARLIRGVDATVCFTSGHGERDHRDTTAAGMSSAARLLRENGYRIQTIELLASGEVPAACDAIVMAAPTSSLGDDVVDAVRSYLSEWGKAFLIADPDAGVEMTAITQAWGIHFLLGIVIEGDPDSHLPGDLTAPIVQRYAGGNPVVRGVGPTFFPRAMGVEVRPPDDPGLTVNEVAFTSELAYLDREDVTTFDPDVDRPGPVALGAAADASEVADPITEQARVNRMRLLAWGDVDFATNAFLGDAANARLWIQGIDWLTQPEDLVTAVPNFPIVRNLELTEARSRYLLLLTAAIIPGLFVVAGGFVWVIRRGR